MNRTSLLIVVSAAVFTCLGCRSKPESPAPLDEPQTTAPGNAGGDILADPNVLALEPQDKITDRRSVESKYETLDGRRVLRVRIDLVTIAVNVEDAIAYFDRRFVELPHLTDEKALADKFRAEPNVREYRYDDFLPGEKDRVYFCVATLLEEGSFLMTLNDTGARVPRIIACKYSQIHSPMDGYAGRLFLLEDNRELFRTMDRIY